MNRRDAIIAGGGTIIGLGAGTVMADAVRADILVDSELTRGKGAPAAMKQSVSTDGVDYLESSQRVRENGDTQPFRAWARTECLEIGANNVVEIIDDRLDKPVEGVGAGVRYLIFGPVITVDHTVTRDRDGEIVSEPNVPLEDLISVTPHTLQVTVMLDGNAYRREIPVGGGHSEVWMN